MSERLNLVEERRYWQTAGNFCVPLEQMKAGAENQQQLWYYLLRNEKCTGIRRDNTRLHMTPLFLVTE